MSRRSTFARIRRPALALVACFLFAIVAPLYFAERRSDEPFAISSVMASPQDLHVLTSPVRLSEAPDITLVRGVTYVYASSVGGATVSNVVLEGPVFTLNAGGMRASGSVEAGGPGEVAAAPLIGRIAALGFDRLLVRRGTVHVTASDGSLETLTDLQAEITGRRKGQVAARGTFSYRGQRLAFDATVGQAADKKHPLRWPFKASIKGSFLSATFDGQVDVQEDLQLVGEADVAVTSLRRAGRWFGIPLLAAEGFNATSIKGPFTWARRSLAFEKVKVVVDGNEGNGRLALNIGGDRPQIDATLDFPSLDLLPYVEAARTQFFGFEFSSTPWSSFDLSLPMIRHIDADLRISARKIGFKGAAFGRGAATITAQSGKLQADITELELQTGTAAGQVTVIMSEPVPRYALRAKLENFDAAAASALLVGAPAVAGRATLALELTSTGYSAQEIMRRLSGKTALTIPEGRVGLDLKNLRGAGKSEAGRGWAGLAKSQTTVEKLEARALIIDGVAFAESIRARAGNKDVSAFGRLGLSDGNMEMRVLTKSVPAPDQASNTTAVDTVTLRGSWSAPTIEEADAALAPR
jgi:AsmA protein